MALWNETIRWALAALLATAAALAIACGGTSGGDEGDDGGGGNPPAGAVTITKVAEGLSSPLLVTGIPGDERLFVMLRSGRVLVLELDEIDPGDLDAAIRATPLIDISAKVESTQGEQGLLGMAVDPDHPSNGLFYLHYNDLSDDSQLSRFEVTMDPNVADPSEDMLLNVDQPPGNGFRNHKGGSIAFSPSDGHLYWALGDGGSGNDPNELAQDGNSHLGKMLRLDVGDAFGDPVSAPADNPFFGFTGVGATDAVLDEIWALGLRNPFRFSFDWLTGDLWIGDVGQSGREEVDFEPAASLGGRNWGWDVREGSASAGGADTAPSPWWQGPAPGSSFTDPALFDEPIFDYPQEPGGCSAGGSGSVTGGVVYRGPFQDFEGLYFFGDFCTGRIWSLDPSTNPVTVEERTDFGAASAPFQIVAFGEDGFGAMYVVHVGGDIYRIGPTGDECDNGVDDDGDGDTDLDDAGCRDGEDPSELDSDTACDDGFDNDADGDLDLQDAECLDSLDDDEAS